MRGVGERGVLDLQFAVALQDAHADGLGGTEDVCLRHALLPRRKIGDVPVSAKERCGAVVGVYILLFVEIPHAAVRELHDAVLVDALVAVHVAGQHQVYSARLRGFEERLVVVAAPALEPEWVVMHQNAELRRAGAVRREEVRKPRLRRGGGHQVVVNEDEEHVPAIEVVVARRARSVGRLIDRARLEVRLVVRI